MEAVGFTEKDEALVKESWEVIKLDLPLYSLRFFAIILEIAPAAKDMFSFLRDSDELPHNNPKLKAHALKVFKMVVREALLRTVEEAMGEDKCNSEMKWAWGVAYDRLAAAIKAQMVDIAAVDAA